jgi:hypothetical protein
MSRFGTSNIQTLCGRKMVELERPTGPIVMRKLSIRVRGGGNIRKWGCLQWATQNGVSWVEEEYGYNRPDKPQVKMNVHAPSKTTVIDTLWCSGWQERPENLVPFIPKPSPSPSPSPTPKNNKRPASPYDLDDEDVADWLEAWKSIGT